MSSHAPFVLAPSDLSWPKHLVYRLGENSPKVIHTIGAVGTLSKPKTALFCSARCPGNVILAAYDQAARWRDEGRCIIGGFHSPVEKECLRILLRGRQPIIICLARGLEKARLPAIWKTALNEERLLVLSPFSASEQRVTRDLAMERNRFVAALADEVVFAHVTQGGHLADLSQRLDSWGVKHRTLVV